MTAGQSRFAKVIEKQKQNTVLNDLINISKESETKSDEITDTKNNSSRNVNEGATEPFVEQKNENEHKIQEKQGPTVTGYTEQQLMDLLVKKIQESSDPRLARRHPKYKGPRLKRSYSLEQNVADWLVTVNETLHVDMTHIVNAAVKEYLEKKYPDLDPRKKTE